MAHIQNKSPDIDEIVVIVDNTQITIAKDLRGATVVIVSEETKKTSLVLGFDGQLVEPR